MYKMIDKTNKIKIPISPYIPSHNAPRSFGPTRKLYTLVLMACAVLLSFILSIYLIGNTTCEEVKDATQPLISPNITTPIEQALLSESVSYEHKRIRSQKFEPVFVELNQEEIQLIEDMNTPTIRSTHTGDLLRLFKKSHTNYAATSKFESGPQNSIDIAITAKLQYSKMRTSLFPHAKEFVFNPASYSGAGLVICIGSRNRISVVHGISTLMALRSVLKCTLPVEVFHLGKDDPINDQDRAKLNEISNVVIRDLTDYTIGNDKAGMGGWDMKPFAILASSFQHAIMMDADTVFLQDPRVLLNSPKYKESGTLFFNDRTLFGNSDENVNWVNSLLTLADQNIVKNFHYMQKKTAFEVESGVVVVDKHTNLIGLAAASFLLMDREVKEEFKKVSYGDKEAFWIAFSAVQMPFSFVHDYKVGSFGKSTSVEKDGATAYTICAVQIIHPDQFGNPLWINGGLSKNKHRDSRDRLKVIEEYMLETREPHWAADIDPDGGGGFCLEGGEKPKMFDETMRNVIDESGKFYMEVYENFK